MNASAAAASSPATAHAFSSHLPPLSAIQAAYARRGNSVIVPVMAETKTGITETVAEVLERHSKQLDHLDFMLHEVHQFITDNRPHLERALAVLDNPVSKYMQARKRTGRG